MRILKKILKVAVGLLAFLFFLLPSFIQSTPLDSNDVRFTISLDKQEYLINEPIWVWVTVENRNEDTAYVTSIDPGLGFIHFYVLSTSGDTVAGACGHFLYLGTPILDPKQKDINLINLLGPICKFGVENEDAVFGKLIPQGEYTVQARLKVSIKLDEQRQNFTVFSNKLKFKVKQPEGVEKKVYDLLVEGYRTLYRERKREEGTEILKRIINEYPHSVYVEVAYIKLPYLTDHEENLKKYITRYPNSGYVWRVLRLKAPRDKDKRKQLFEEVIKKYPGTKASACAEILLDKWKRGKLWPDEKIE